MVSIIKSSISEEYFKQRKSNSSKIDLKPEGDITFSFSSLNHILKYGQCLHDCNFLALLFDEMEERETEEKTEVIDVNEKLTGESLTHLTLDVSNILYEISDMKYLRESLDLCPNLVYLNLSFYYSHYSIDVEALSESIQKLTKLRTLIICIEGHSITDHQINIFGSRISKLRNLTELNLEITHYMNNLNKMDGFYKEFSEHKVLNTLYIKGLNLQKLDKATVFGSTFNWRKIKRLVQKDIKFVPEDDYDGEDDLGFGFF